jgi:hypothetical protein
MKYSHLRTALSNVYRNPGFSGTATEPLPPTSTDLERERLSTRRAQVLTQLDMADRQIHPLSNATSVERTALLREKKSLTQQLAFIERQMESVR